MNRELVLALSLVLCACTPGQKVWMESDAEIQAEDTSVLCTALSYLHSSPRALGELERRGEIRPQYVSAIRAHQVQIGMNTCEVRASWGLPEHVNHTAVPGREMLQLVYSFGRYVYIEEGGAVAAVQD